MTAPPPVAVLTSANSVTCNHAKPGKVALTKTPKLRVATSEVLLVAGTGTVVVVGCTPSTTADVACLTATVTGGKASKLRVGGEPVALARLKGTATGTVEGVVGAVKVTEEPAAKLVAR